MLLSCYPRRTILFLALMVSQAFLYNAIFFPTVLVAAAIAFWLGVDAERKPLEAVAPPLNSR